MFKIGDNVIVIRVLPNENTELIIGEKFKVEKIDNCGNELEGCVHPSVYNICPKQCVNRFCAFRFELDREAKLRRILDV